MSTNSRIAIKNSNGSVRSVYCHWDGYPSGVGKILLEHYQDEKKVNDLINLGYISSLHQNINPVVPETHSHERPENNCSVVYHRDRGDDLEIDDYPTISNWSVFEERHEWNYIWKDGAWYFQGSECKSKYKKLTKLLKSHVENNNIH